jgi:phosphate-selective porin OprO and OprP
MMLPLLVSLLAAPDPAPAPASVERNVPTSPAASAPIPLEASPTHAGVTPGEGIRWTTDDGRFSLGLGLLAQVLHTVAYDVDARETAQSLELRRARVRFEGHAFGPHNRYFVHLAFSPRDLGIEGGRPTHTPIFDWYLDFDHIPDLVLRVGQYRVPWNRQRRVPVARLLMIDRAMANFEFTLDRDVGLSLRSPDFMGWGWLRYEAGVFIGEGRDAFAPDGAGMLYAGRVELLPLGMFTDYDEVDRERSRRPRLGLGGGYAFLAEGKGNRGILGPPPSDGGTTDSHNVTADAVLKVAGVSLLGEFYWRRGQRRFGDAVIDDPVLGPVPAPREPARNGWGWFGQLGWLVPRTPLTLGTRYGFVRPQGNSSLPARDEVAASVGWSFFGPALQLMGDYTRGWTQGAIAEGGMHQVRVQLQAGF